MNIFFTVLCLVTLAFLARDIYIKYNICMLKVIFFAFIKFFVIGFVVVAIILMGNHFMYTLGLKNYQEYISWIVYLLLILVAYYINKKINLVIDLILTGYSDS